MKFLEIKPWQGFLKKNTLLLINNWTKTNLDLAYTIFFTLKNILQDFLKIKTGVKKINNDEHYY